MRDSDSSCVVLVMLLVGYWSWVFSRSIHLCLVLCGISVKLEELFRALWF